MLHKLIAMRDRWREDARLQEQMDGSDEALRFARQRRLDADELDDLIQEYGWQPIETAPIEGVIQLAVEGGDEHRVFVAEASLEEGDSLVWIITTGWTGWTRLRSEWRPVGWLPLASAKQENDNNG